MTANRAAATTPAESSELTTVERQALAEWGGKVSPKLTARTGAPLARLIQPILAATTGWPATDAAVMRNLLLREVHHRQRPYWAWDEDTWVEVAGPSWRDRSSPRPNRRRRLLVIALGHLLGGQRRLHARVDAWRLRGLADLLYGAEPVGAALEQVAATLASWGVSPHSDDQVAQATMDLLLTRGGPHLADITAEQLTALVAEYPAGSNRRKGLFKVSRVLAHLGIIPTELTTNHHRSGPWPQTLESVPQPWLDWALRWRRPHWSARPSAAGSR